MATVEPRTGAPGCSWEAILQITVDPAGTVSALDLALPGHPCAVAQTSQDAARAVQHFESDGARLRQKSKRFRSAI